LLDPDRADDRSTIVLPIQPSGSRTPLLCLIRGEAVHAARHLSSVLGPDQPVFAIWAPTMHGSREVAGTIEEIAAACVAAVQAVQPEGPYVLFGHSLGGIVVYEMARQLAAAEQRVALVVLADAPYPARLRWGRDLALPRLRVLFSRDGGAAVARRLRRAGRRIGDRRTERDVATEPDEARPAPRSEELLDEAAAFRRQLEWGRVPRPAGGPVLVLRTRSRERRGPFLGWDDVVASDLESRAVPGSHRTMLGEPYVFAVAEILAEVLPRAQDGGRPAG
jgi:thioesterase domain-containing protein